MAVITDDSLETQRLGQHFVDDATQREGQIWSVIRAIDRDWMGYLSV